MNKLIMPTIKPMTVIIVGSSHCGFNHHEVVVEGTGFGSDAGSE